jgi:hypothetical protein
VTSSEPAGPATVAEYLQSLPPERREVVAEVRDALAAAMPAGYREAIAFGMITWSIPLERYPDTYNGQPLGYVALAAQKRYYAVYLMGLYSDSEEAASFRQRWEAGGRRLDMGKSCLRFRRMEDLDLDLLTEVVAGTSVPEYLERYERARGSSVTR